jgi:hypothetical protein
MSQLGVVTLQGNLEESFLSSTSIGTVKNKHDKTV